MRWKKNNQQITRRTHTQYYWKLLKQTLTCKRQIAYHNHNLSRVYLNVRFQMNWIDRRFCHHVQVNTVLTEICYVNVLKKKSLKSSSKKFVVYFLRDIFLPFSIQVEKETIYSRHSNRYQLVFEFFLWINNFIGFNSGVPWPFPELEWPHRIFVNLFRFAWGFLARISPTWSVLDSNLGLGPRWISARGPPSDTFYQNPWLNFKKVNSANF